MDLNAKNYSPTETTTRTRRMYSDRFKSEAVTLVLESGRTPSEVAEKLGVHPANVARWVALARDKYKPTPQAKTSTGEVDRLREENRKLRLENEALQWVALTFSKEAGFDIKITRIKD